MEPVRPYPAFACVRAFPLDLRAFPARPAQCWRAWGAFPAAQAAGRAVPDAGPAARGADLPAADADQIEGDAGLPGVVQAGADAGPPDAVQDGAAAVPGAAGRAERAAGPGAQTACRLPAVWAVPPCPPAARPPPDPAPPVRERPGCRRDAPARRRWAWRCGRPYTFRRARPHGAPSGRVPPEGPTPAFRCRPLQKDQSPARFPPWAGMPAFHLFQAAPAQPHSGPFGCGGGVGARWTPRFPQPVPPPFSRQAAQRARPAPWVFAAAWAAPPPARAPQQAGQRASARRAPRLSVCSPSVRK